MEAAQLQGLIEAAAELNVDVTDSLVGTNEVALILTDEVTEETREDLGAVELINIVFGDNIGISVGILIDHDTDLIYKDGRAFGEILGHEDMLALENIGVDLTGEPQGDVGIDVRLIFGRKEIQQRDLTQTPPKVLGAKGSDDAEDRKTSLACAAGTGDDRRALRDRFGFDKVPDDQNQENK